MSEISSALPYRRGAEASPRLPVSVRGVASADGAVGGNLAVARDPGPARPWYFSTRLVVLAYFLFSPVGSVLILTDSRRSRKAKIRAIAVLLFSLTLLIYRLWFMPPIHF